MNTKLEYFFKNRIKIHVACFGYFYNGFIYDLDSQHNLMVFLDDELGTIPILFSEIKRVEPKKEVKINLGENGEKKPLLKHI